VVLLATLLSCWQTWVNAEEEIARAQADSPVEQIVAEVRAGAVLNIARDVLLSLCVTALIVWLMVRAGRSLKTIETAARRTATETWKHRCHSFGRSPS
jgi:hypothetical protein